MAPAEAPSQESVTELPAFPSLEVCVTPASRLVYFTEPDSLAAEKFRFLGVRLRQLQQTRQLKKVLVTSTIPEEGKSLVSANLAGVLARRKQRVLLIEGDHAASYSGSAIRSGKTLWSCGVVAERAADGLEHLPSWRPGFVVLARRQSPANPLELMQSGRLSQLMRQLAALFDWIIVDSPPLLPLADTTVWSRVTDGPCWWRAKENRKKNSSSEVWKL